MPFFNFHFITKGLIQAVNQLKKNFKKSDIDMMEGKVRLDIFNILADL